jgi:hypothetical protein
MDFAEAALLQLRAKEASEAFSKVSAEHREGITDEIEGLMRTFRNVLDASRDKVFSLSEGGYLFLKTVGTPLPINEDRIGAAVEQISQEQLRRIADEGGTPADVVSACLEENLEDVCVKVHDTPAVVKRRPDTGDDRPIRSAPLAVSRAAHRYVLLKERLAELNRAVKVTNKRCAEAVEVTRPVICAFMEERKTSTQPVRFTPDAIAGPDPTPDDACPDLPAIPALLQAHIDEDLARADVAVARPKSKPDPPIHVSVPSGAPVCEVKFRIKTRTSKGRAPRLRQFARSIEAPICTLVSSSRRSSDLRRWATTDGKKEILAVMLAQYRQMFEATKGKTTETLTMARARKRKAEAKE